MDTAIITGCTGQAGSYFVDYLLANTDLNIVGTVRRLSVPNHKNISHINDSRFKLETMDLTDSTSINELVKKYKPKYFINAAANSFVGSSWKLPLQHFDINALGVLRVLEAIKEHSPETRFYNFGSSEEWGDVQYSPQDENHPPRARSPYGASKIAARQIIKVYRESYGLYAIQGWSLNYESERRGEEFVTRKITKGVARIHHAIKNNKPFDPIELGNLNAKRDWSHATDIVDGVWRMLNQEEYRTNMPIKFPPVNACIFGEYRELTDEERTLKIDTKLIVPHLREYVLSSGEMHSVREFVTLAFQAAGIKGVWSIKLNGDPLTEVYRYNDSFPLVIVNPEFYRPAEVEQLMGTSKKIMNDLGWRPKVSFPKLLERMVKSDITANSFN